MNWQRSVPGPQGVRDSRGVRGSPDLAQTGQLRPVVVIGLGTNYIVTTSQLNELLQIIGPHRRLVLINTYVPDGWSKQVNATDAAFVQAHPSVVLADWYDTIRGRLYLLWPDQVHPMVPGTLVYAQLVYEAVQATRNVSGTTPVASRWWSAATAERPGAARARARRWGDAAGPGGLGAARGWRHESCPRSPPASLRSIVCPSMPSACPSIARIKSFDTRQFAHVSGSSTPAATTSDSLPSCSPTGGTRSRWRRIRRRQQSGRPHREPASRPRRRCLRTSVHRRKPRPVADRRR